MDFRDAIPAIEDPNRLEEIDERGEYGEAGTAIIGVAHDRVLFVIVTLRGERYLPHHQCPEGGTT